MNTVAGLDVSIPLGLGNHMTECSSHRLKLDEAGSRFSDCIHSLLDESRNGSDTKETSEGTA